jgi:hypothetical protein
MSNYTKTLKQGESFSSLEVRHEKGSPLLPWDLTGYTITLRFKNFYKGNIVKTMTIGSGLSLVGTNIVVTSPFIVDWEVGTYIFDMDLVSPTGTYSRSFLSGNVTVKESV